MSKLLIKKRYATIPNDILNDDSISLKAKGLYAYLQSKPDNWRFSTDRMSQSLKEGKEAIKTALHELEKTHYLQRISVKNNKGRWDGYDYILYDVPYTENPLMVPQLTDNLATLSKQDSSKQELNKQESFVVANATNFLNKSINNFIYPNDKPQTESEFIEKCRLSPQRYIRLIGEWADTIHPNCHTVGQWQVFLKRNLRPAKDLAEYNDLQISDALVKIEKADYLTKYTLETLIKYI